jgi:hypothetical protein
MTNICRLLLLVEIVLLSPWSFAQGKALSPAAGLVFHIKPVTTVLDVGSDIALDFSLKNNSHNRILATREASLHDLIYMDVVDERGRRIEWRGKVSNRRYPSNFFIVLQPGESISFRSTISFSNGEGYALQKPGAYRISASFSLSPKEYFAPVAQGATIPERPVGSNWIRLVVVAAKAKAVDHRKPGDIND